MKRKIALIVLLVLLMSSCVTKSPYTEYQYFQALGLDGHFVFTINANLLDLSLLINNEDQAINYITNKMDRLSVALNEDSSFYGAIEGNFSKLIVDSALSLNSKAEKLKDSNTNIKYYKIQDSTLEVAMPQSGLILFSSDDVVNTYINTVSERVHYISDEDAKKLASSQIGIYVSRPKTLLDLGFEIPTSALENIRDVLIIVDDNIISIDFTLNDESLAKSFSIIIKTTYIAKLKLEGKSVNIAELKTMFTQELDKVSVNELKLTDKQYDDIKQTIFGLMDIVISEDKHEKNTNR